MCSGSEAGSYLTLIDSCSTQLKAQGPSRTCNESKEEEAIEKDDLPPLRAGEGGDCEDRVRDGPASGGEGLQVSELARLYSG